MTMRRRLFVAATLAAALVSGAILLPGLVSPARAGAAGPSTEVRGTVKDMEGKALEGIEVQMVQIDSTAKPFVAKTRKDGGFVFPFLPYHTTGKDMGRDKPSYNVVFVADGLHPAKIHIVSRAPQSVADKGEGQKFQDDEGTLKPGDKLPPIFIKPGGTVRIEVSLAPQSFFGAAAAPAAAAAGGSAAPGGPAAGGGAAAAATPQISGHDQARLLASQGKFPEAIAEMDKSIQESPTAEKWLDLGKMKMKAQDNDGAKAAFARASGLDPNTRGAHFLLGKLYNDEGRTDQAIVEMEKEQALDPTDLSTQRALGALYHNAKRTPDAIAIFEKVIAVEPDSDTLARLAGLQAETGNFKRSEELYRKILEMNPGQADAVYMKIGRSVMSQENLGTDERKRAADAFERALQANPSNAKAHIELAYVLLGLGDIPKAKDHMKRYLELEPNAKDATDVRAQLKDLP